MCLCFCFSHISFLDLLCLDTPLLDSKLWGAAGKQQHKAHMAICLLGSGDTAIRNKQSGYMPMVSHSIMIANSTILNDKI